MKKTGFLLITILLCFSCTKKQIEKTETGPYVEPLKMVFVGGGEYIMGNLDNDDKDIFSDNVVPHKVSVSSFLISTTEITQSLYREIMQDEKWYDPQKINYPIRDVPWYNAVEFCNRLSERDGFEKCYTIEDKNVICNFEANGYRLPTEAEWEFAAYGGNLSQRYRYSGANDSYEVINYDADGIYEVGKYKPNELGLYDMTGNASEWCWDFYDAVLYPKSQTKNPKGLSNSDGEKYWRVVKGGCYYRIKPIPYRMGLNPETAVLGSNGSFAVGFRICQTIIE